MTADSKGVPLFGVLHVVSIYICEPKQLVVLVGLTQYFVELNGFEYKASLIGVNEYAVPDVQVIVSAVLNVNELVKVPVVVTLLKDPV